MIKVLKVELKQLETYLNAIHEKVLFIFPDATWTGILEYVYIIVETEP